MKNIIIDPETNHKSFYFFSKLPISIGNEIIFIPLKSILKLEANSYCTKIYLYDSQQTFTTSKNLGYYEKVLPEYAFFRVQNK